MKLVKVGLASLLTAGALFGATFTVDKAHSSVDFKVKHMMITNVSGSFGDFDGSFEYDEKTNTLTSLKGVVKVVSIDTNNEKRDKHLRTSDFFDAQNHPELTLVIDKVEGDTAYGKLTMRGVTKDIKMDLELSGMTIKDGWGNIKTGLNLSGSVDRYDYGIKYGKVLEAGGLSIGKKVKFSIDLQGKKVK
jgi:polyisoprenoid-binding protein YceI